MTSHFTPSATILHPEASCADALRMGSDRAHSFYTSAIVGCGMVFILGAFLATDAANTRGLLAGLFFGILSGGIYVLVLLRKTSALSRENTDLRELNSEAGARDDDLRAQLGYTLCEPLAVAAGKADELLSSPSMPYGDQQAILTSIRDNTLEVEQTLKALAAHGSLRTATTPRLSSVVLLDEELRSIGQASPNFDHYDFDIEQARAWGDPALVRQILRTLVNVSTHDDGAHLTLQTTQRCPFATAMVSGKGTILPLAARAALSDDYEFAGSDDGTFKVVRAVSNLAATMGGAISYVQAFGVSHVLLTLPASEPKAPTLNDLQPGSEPTTLFPDPQPGSARSDSTNAVHSPS
jgi:hypothetical protein